MIVGEKVILRPVEFSDAPTVMAWENDKANWGYSGTTKEYRFEEITQLIESAMDFDKYGQYRWIIVRKDNNASIGTLDIFKHDKDKKSVDTGILIQEEINREQGFAKESIELLAEHLKTEGFDWLGCTIQNENKASVRLFSRIGFEEVDEKDNNLIRMQLCLKK